MLKPLDTGFYGRPALEVAPELLGLYLCRKLENGQLLSYIINEVEAYCGEKDLASHASKGRTKRTEVMFGPPGHWYVYLCYGIHEMVNVVTDPDGTPGAVLLRGTLEVSGPGRLTKSMAIDRRLNGLKIDAKSGLWIADGGVRLSRREYERTPRIGVDYAGPVWSRKPYRFVAEPSRLQKKLSRVRSA